MRLAILLAALLLLAPVGAQAQRCSAPLPPAAGVPPTSINPVVVRVLDGNDRQIDNGKPGPDRRQIARQPANQMVVGGAPGTRSR